MADNYPTATTNGGRGSAPLNGTALIPPIPSEAILTGLELKNLPHWEKSISVCKTPQQYAMVIDGLEEEYKVELVIAAEKYLEGIKEGPLSLLSERIHTATDEAAKADEAVINIKNELDALPTKSRTRHMLIKGGIALFFYALAVLGGVYTTGLRIEDMAFSQFDVPTILKLVLGTLPISASLLFYHGVYARYHD